MVTHLVTRPTLVQVAPTSLEKGESTNLTEIAPRMKVKLPGAVVSVANPSVDWLQQPKVSGYVGS